MATPAQVGGASVGAGSLAAAGGYGITYYVKSDSTEEEAEPTSVKFQTSDLSSLTGKVLNVFKDENLVKLVKATDENNKWWDWAFKNKYQVRNPEITFDSSFSSLKDSSALKNSCERAYKQDRSKFQDLALSIAAFCTEGTDSLDLSEPRVTFYSGSVEGYTNGLLSVDENKAKLVKTSITEQEKTTIFNDLWWDWAYKNIFLKQTENRSANFANIDKGYNTSDANALSKVCDESYKKNYTELKTTNLLNDIKRFCTLNPQGLVLLLPEPTSKATLNSDTGYGEKGVAKKSTNTSKLIDPANTSNQDWWEWSFGRHFPIPNKTELPEPFKNVTSGYEAATSGSESNNPTALNKACKKSYDKKHGEVGTKEQTDSLINLIQKLCTSGQTLDLPDNTQ